ncbi:GumC family protein [Tichowtungia aerotolerans]|uniref:non-specific protein-tyrosine kinase n=1 Tax=Tichowtungia aerotolerans TaxID=2697043 RepID=A0A6P1MB10_9BACT|nr:polysaccharide biosynthesis tyrosine autokinase [Tichowtungia aerotolerans]QHI70293.1 polysaccharide biosynthesis tyrosine autokinase [Tichowtungia aerotolerans]
MNENQSKETTLHFLDYWRVIRSRKEIVLAVLFLVVITGTVYTFTLPKIYAAEARIEVNNDNVNLDPFSYSPMDGSRYDPYFLRTQYEIIKSKPILYEVINRLNLQEAWGKDGQNVPKEKAYKILFSSLDVAQSRDTSLIALRARRQDPREAMRIANTLADVYRDQRLDLKYKEMTRSIDALRRELENQQEKVDTAEQQVEELREKLGITVLSEGVDGGSASIEKLRLQQLEGDRVSARVDMLVQKARYEQLEAMSNDDLLTASAYLASDPFVESMRTEIKNLDVQLSSLLENYGVNHPEVKQAKAARDELMGKLAQALDGIKKGVKAQYVISKSKFDALEEELRGAQSEDRQSQREKLLPFNKAQRELDLQRSLLDALKARLAQEGITLKVPRTPVEIVDAAEESNRPVSPNLFLNMLLSIFVGLGAGVGLAYFIEYLDTSIKTADDVERWVDLPVLGLIPQKVRPLIEEGPDSDHAEGYRVLRTNMSFTDAGGPTKGAFAVLSGGAGEGKSTTAFNLAYVCAQQGEKVLLVDADLRRPVQHTILGVSNRFGLTNVLLRDVPVEETIKTTSVPNLHFLPSGRLPRTSLGVLDPKRIGELVSSLKSKYDVVIFDTPPLVGISDSAVIAKEVDGIIMVVQYRKYPRDMIIRAKQMLDTLGVEQVGVVLNNINIMRDDYYYYYHSYYSNYYYYRSDESLPAGSPEHSES